MKGIFVAIWLLLTLGAVSGVALAAVGGPDAAGYTFVDTAGPNGPVFIANDISGTGTDILNSCDDCLTTVPIGFSFTMYGTAFTSVNVSPNGNLQFETAVTTFINTALPANLFGRTIFAYYDDLRTDCAPGTLDRIFVQTTGAAGSRRFTVQWHQLEPFGCAPTDGITFQAILFEGTNEILVQYLDSTFGGLPARSNGLGATAGIQRDTGVALQYSFNQGVLTAGQAICYRPPASSATSVCTGTVAATTGTFIVSKAYSNATTAPVTIHVTCGGGASVAGPLQASPGSPAVFTVLNPGAGATCSATEIVPTGFTANDLECAGRLITAGTTTTCTIINSPSTSGGGGGGPGPTPAPTATPVPVVVLPPPPIPQGQQNPAAILAVQGGIGNGTRNNTPVPARPAVAAPAAVAPSSMPQLRPPSTGDAGLLLTLE